MTRLTQICVLFVATLWCEKALSSPIFESINIDRKLNIEFKPLKFGPITFIREKWGPFGKFIKKHTIERRDLDEMNTVDGKLEDAKPVVEERLIPVFEKEEPIMGPVPVYRSPVQAVVVESVPPPVSKLNTDISEAIAANPIAEAVPSYRPPVQAVVVESDPPPVSKLNTDISEAIPVKPIPVSPIPVSPIPVGPFFTPVRAPDIKILESLAEVPIVGSPKIEGPLLVPVTPVIPPSSPPPPPPPANPEVPPGSRFGAFARFFGEILSEIVNRLIARARLSFSQFTNQPAAVQ